MDRIAAGEMTKGEVVGESRDLLHKTWSEIDRDQRGPGQSRLGGDGPGPHPRPLQGLRRSGPQEGGRLAPHAAHHPREKIGQTLRRLHRLDGGRPRVVRPDLPAAPARRRLQARGPLLDLRADAAAQSRALPRPVLEPLPQRRLRVDAGDEETPRRARSRESGERGDGRRSRCPRATRTARRRRRRKRKCPKRTPRRAGANAPKAPKPEVTAVVRLPGGSRRLGQEHPGEAARGGARPGDAADPRAGGDRRRRADPRAARRPGAGDRPLRRAAALLRRPRRPRQPRDPARARGGPRRSSPTASPTPASPTRAAPGGWGRATCSRSPTP